jgi:16S rRNA processing protein RimM
MASPSRLVQLGVFGAAQGVRGEVRVKSFTAEAKAIGGYGVLTDRTGARTFRFEAVRPLRDDMLVVRLAGVTTRDAAEALTGVEIFARRVQLPPPAAEEFYYDDLIGLTAVTSNGAPLGRVAGLRNFGAGDILEIAPVEGGETLLLPFTKAVATDIDFAGGRIVVAPPREIDGESEDEKSTSTP